MTALLRWDNATGMADLVLDANNRIVQADPLVADVFASLSFDAPADAGDPVPDGVDALGSWAAQMQLAGATSGSKLWMVRYVRPADRARAFAKRAVEDALEWMVDAGTVVTASAEATYNERERMLVIEIALTLTDGTRRTFQTEVEYAV